MDTANPEQTFDDAPPATAKSDAAAKTGAGTGSHATIQAVTINKPVGELFEIWRGLTTLPAFMDNVERIDVLDERRSHWVVKAPGGRTVEWTARFTEIEENRVLAWESEEGADVANSGRVTFAEAGARGTVVSATLVYDPPAGVIGKVIAKLFQREPALQARRDLRRFKQLMETGEIATNVRNRAQLEEEGK